jgi:dTDP-4-amino-4,6-dideoxygalactose transaminase
MTTYKVPFVDFPAEYRRLKDEIDAAIKDVFSRGDFILRGQVQQFERNIASLTGTDYAVGVNSCTDAMFLSLKAAGIAPGDEVITVAHTFVATAAAIVHCGATPILVDIGGDFNMDVAQVEQAVSPRTKAIMPVHLNGRLCEMDKLMNIVSRRNLIVIEDAAQALGATFDGQKAGSFGLAGCFSFYPAKSLGGAGDGGIVVTNDQEFAEKIRLYRDHGRITKEEIAFFGFNSRLDNLQAAILNVKLDHLPQWIERRRELASLYHQGLSEIPYLKLPPSPQTQGRFFDTYQNYVVRAQERDKLIAYLEECGIEVLVSWPKPMHHHEALALGHFRLPVTERISTEVVSLPLNTEISDEQVKFVIDSIHDFYRSVFSR